MSSLLFGFHAINVRLKINSDSILEIYFDSARRDNRMKQFLINAKELKNQKIKLIAVDNSRLNQLSGHKNHQGIVAKVEKIENFKNQNSLDNFLDSLEDKIPLILVLDSITDPHNLGACLRVADASGVNCVIAPKDRAVGINSTVAKVSSGTSESLPYFMVTNLARTLNELKERNILIIGTDDKADKNLYEFNWKVPLALVMGAEGKGLRQLTRKTCDELIKIPMLGVVESLNVSVASGVCLFEAVRQRLK